MKRSRADIDRAMSVSRLREPDFAKLPLCFGRRRGGALKPQISIGKRDHDVVIPVNVPEGRVTRRHSNVPDADKFVFDFWMVMSFAADFDGRLRRVRL